MFGIQFSNLMMTYKDWEKKEFYADKNKDVAVIELVSKEGNIVYLNHSANKDIIKLTSIDGEVLEIIGDGVNFQAYYKGNNAGTMPYEQMGFNSKLLWEIVDNLSLEEFPTIDSTEILEFEFSGEDSAIYDIDDFIA